MVYINFPTTYYGKFWIDPNYPFTYSTFRPLNRYKNVQNASIVGTYENSAMRQFRVSQK